MKLDFSHIPFAQSFVISASSFVSELRFVGGHELVVQIYCIGVSIIVLVSYSESYSTGVCCYSTIGVLSS